MTRVEATDEDREAVEAGALTVAGAVEFSGISERALFRHMAAGELDWFPMGAKRTRYIPRAALIELMARCRAQHRARTN